MSSESPQSINQLVKNKDDRNFLKKCMSLLTSLIETINILFEQKEKNKRDISVCGGLPEQYEKLFKVYTDYEDDLPEHFWSAITWGFLNFSNSLL